jgi:hypothetical protein
VAASVDSTHTAVVKKQERLLGFHNLLHGMSRDIERNTIAARVISLDVYAPLLHALGGRIQLG